MSDFWWRLYKSLPIFNMGMKRKLLISFLILAVGPILTLGGIGIYGTTGSLRLAVVLVVVSSVFCIYFFAGIFARNLTWLLFRLLEETKKVEGGDLRGSLEAEYSNDEIGQLTLSFKQMVSNLRGIVLNVMEAGNTVSSSSQELAAAGEEMNASIEEIASSIQRVAETAQNQSVQINDAVEEIKEVAEKAKGISQNADEATTASENLVSLAKKGGELSSKAVDKINESNVGINESAQKLKELQKESKRIGEIVEVITGIADQTNLLALNAAIEAARAGEHGRGFAVVAEEVRKLAEESAKMADEISRLIGEMQEENKNAVSSIEKSFSEFKNTTEIVNEALGVLGVIKESVETSNTLIKDISKSSLDQTKGVENVLKKAEEITAGIEESAAAVEEVSAAAEEQAASTQELSSSAQSLAELAQDLSEIINHFKINGEEITEKQEGSKVRKPSSLAEAF